MLSCLTVRHLANLEAICVGGGTELRKGGREEFSQEDTVGFISALLQDLLILVGFPSYDAGVTFPCLALCQNHDVSRQTPIKLVVVVELPFSSRKYQPWRPDIAPDSKGSLAVTDLLLASSKSCFSKIIRRKKFWIRRVNILIICWIRTEILETAFASVFSFLI